MNRLKHKRHPKAGPSNSGVLKTKFAFRVLPQTRIPAEAFRTITSAATMVFLMEAPHRQGRLPSLQVDPDARPLVIYLPESLDLKFIVARKGELARRIDSETPPTILIGESPPGRQGYSVTLHGAEIAHNTAKISLNTTKIVSLSDASHQQTAQIAQLQRDVMDTNHDLRDSKADISALHAQIHAIENSGRDFPISAPTSPCTKKQKVPRTPPGKREASSDVDIE